MSKTVLDTDIWASAIRMVKSSKIARDNDIEFIGSVYANLGGRFAEDMERKDNNESPIGEHGRGEKVRFDDKHRDADGKAMTKVPEKEQSKKEEGWTEYENKDTQTTRSYRDGAPIYNADKKVAKKVTAQVPHPADRLKDPNNGYTDPNSVVRDMQFIKEKFDYGDISKESCVRQIDALMVIYKNLMMADLNRPDSDNFDGHNPDKPDYDNFDGYEGPDGREPEPGFNKKAKKKVTAQGMGGSVDPAAGEPGIETDAKQSPKNTGNPKLMGDEPTADGLAGKDINEELLADKVDNSNIVEAVRAFLSVLLINAEGLETDGVLEELKEIFTQDDLYNEFKGKLDQSIAGKKEEDKSVEDQSAKEFLDMVGEEPQEPNQAPPTPSVPKLAHLILSAPKFAMLFKRQAAKMNNELEEMNNEFRQLKAKYESEIGELKELRTANNKLLIERSVRLRFPRSKRLASKMVAIGELDVGESQENTIFEKAAQLVTLSDDKFLEIESRVDKIFEKVGNKQELEEDEQLNFLTYIPNHVTANSKLMEFGKRREMNEVKPQLWSGKEKSQR